MVHVELTVTQFSPVETVIVAPLTAVKVTDRVATARVTSAVFSVELVVNSADALVAYPVADPVRV
jgi:hypothetical protein